MEVEAICGDYAYKSVPAAVAMTHVSGDFNLGSVLRNANFFGFREAFYIGGSKRWDKRAAVGTYHYTPLTHFKTIQEFFTYIQNRYTPIALENNIKFKSENLFEFKWPNSPCLIVGEETLGLPDEVLTKCQNIVTIPAYGTVRSINVSTAAGIAMADFRNKK